MEMTKKYRNGQNGKNSQKWIKTAEKDPESWKPQISTTPNLNDPESQQSWISTTLNLVDPNSTQNLTAPNLENPEIQPWKARAKGGEQWFLWFFSLSDSSIYW